MVVHFFMHLPKEIVVMLIAAAPILELRAAIPYALFVDPKLSPVRAFFLSVLGSWLPTFFIVFILKHVEPLLRKINWLNTFIDKVYAKTRAESVRIKAVEFWGLVLFVAIPLPGAGVWTGALAGYLVGLSAAKILAASLLGTFIAGLLVMFLSAYLVLLIRYTLLSLLITLIALSIYFIYKRFVQSAGFSKVK